MAFGLVHLVYGINAVVMTFCFFLLLRRYLAERNKLTLIFTFFILTFIYVCLVFIGRGFFEVNTIDSVFYYRLYVVGMPLISVVLATFMLYPLILQKDGFKKNIHLSSILGALWILAFASILFIVTGEVTYSFTELGVDIYSVAFGPLSYMMILALPLTIGIIDILGFAYMAYRETESFYRTRAILLLCGWMLSILGVIIVLVRELLLFNPILFGLGAILMAYAIIRKPK